jgi:hypothetical protein
MTVPDGGSCATCKHRNLVAIPRETRPGGALPCRSTPLCGYELDAAVLQGAKAFMEKDPLEGAELMTTWDKTR